MSGREDEAVAILPLRMRGAVMHHLGVEEVGKRRERHRSARMACAGRLDGVHRQRPDRVDGELRDVLVGHVTPGSPSRPNDMPVPHLYVARTRRGEG